MGFRERLVEAYSAKFETRADFARAMGVQYHQVMAWEGDRLPSAKHLVTIAKLTGRSVDWLLGADSQAEGGDESPESYDDQIREVATYAELTPDETRRLASIRQSVGRASTARLKSYAADIIEARGEGKAALPHNAARDRAEAEPSRVKPGRTPMRR